MIKLVYKMSRIKKFYLFESKRISLPKEIDDRLIALTNKLWESRGISSKKKTKVDEFLFKTLDGAQGMVKIFVDPNQLDAWGSVDTEPLYSRDPMDFVIILANIDDFESKSHLYNVIYHEMIHAVDPTQSTKFSAKYQSGYKWWGSDSDYYSHRIEQNAIFGEVLNAFVKAFQFPENKDKKLLDSVFKFFMNPLANKRKLNTKAKKIIYACTGSDRAKILENVIKWDKSAYKEFLKKLYSTYVEIKKDL